MVAHEGWEAVLAKVNARSPENKGLLGRYGGEGPLPKILVFQGRSVSLSILLYIQYSALHSTG